MKRCWECGSTHGLERHHIFFGPFRKVSEKWGMCVWLCWRHHNTNSPESVHRVREFDLRLKRWAQQEFVELYPEEDFMSTFKRNYL